MLLREVDDGVIAIAQPSHAWLSGQLARAWGNERFGAVEPHAEVCLAAEQHDLGMGPWDAAPERNPATGLPFAFTEMPVALHLRQWREGPERLLMQSRYAALLASRHGSRLQRRRTRAELAAEEADAVRAYLDGQRAFEARLQSSLAAAPELLERNHQLLWTWDFLSLALCLDWAPTTAHDVPTTGEPVELELIPAGGDFRLRLEPWPLRRPAFSVRCEGRRLRGRYESDEALREALAEAPWEALEFELVPG
ncbi:MAG: DUF3891 family protein [Solirubrobacterales bacterium]|nr:DUF3891 family protein [Solirubrobacterales bacterium]MBV9714168.1 DUF3891 family protein [Solirubrobacterales bacterium]